MNLWATCDADNITIPCPPFIKAPIIAKNFLAISIKCAQSNYVAQYNTVFKMFTYSCSVFPFMMIMFEKTGIERKEEGGEGISSHT